MEMPYQQAFYRYNKTIVCAVKLQIAQNLAASGFPAMWTSKILSKKILLVSKTV
jgi:hypothetical protein